jgi:serine/threonine protein kinase
MLQGQQQHRQQWTLNDMGHDMNQMALNGPRTSQAVPRARGDDSGTSLYHDTATLLRSQPLFLESLVESSGSSRLHFATQIPGLKVVNRSEIQTGEKLIDTLKSAVHRATWRGHPVVAKQALLESEMTKKDLEKEMMNEMCILSSIWHPDLVPLMGVCFDDPLVLMYEYMPGGDLEHHYMKNRRIHGSTWVPTIQTMKAWSGCIARALSYLHSLPWPIVHRDLKPLNLLLSGNHKEVKLGDFGNSKVMNHNDGHLVASFSPLLDNTGAGVQEKMTGGVGSWAYMAPEVARHASYNEKADIFSFALVMYFISSGRDPYHEVGLQNIGSVLDLYVQGKQPRPKVSDCPHIFRPILTAAWCERPEQRPKASDLVDHLAGLHASCCTLM